MTLETSDIAKLKALSIRQPWAWAILHAGKDVENRDWKPSNWWLQVRGTILIHTGMKVDDELTDEWREFLRFTGARLHAPDEKPTGGIVGMVDVVDVVARPNKSPWFMGPYGLVLANPRPLTLIPCRGQLGYFDPKLSDARIAQIQRELQT